MTMTISEQAFNDLCQEVEATAQADPNDPLDVTYAYPATLGQGVTRVIQLRSGLGIEIFQGRIYQHHRVQYSEDPGWLEYHFHLLGQHIDTHTMVGDKEYALYGSGSAPREIRDAPEQQALEVQIYLQPEALQGFVSNRSGQLPSSLQHLIRPVSQEIYTRVAKLTPGMESILWQIVRCGHQGVLKRLYLEGKALELMSLVLEQESEIQTGQRAVKSLNAGTLERIHYAKTLLLLDVQAPPSLPELARQAKLNEYTLKRGFKQVFGTPVFVYLHQYRLEQARHLLEQGHLSVSEVMTAVGLSDRQYFAASFRKKFGFSPREYLMQYRSC
ncbi:helix-turn-helix domain-containing protein [Myxacorys almedinensis]|uniref:Helix-turn-helix domain-containing protein n=1 Tax=Myxacorys almedinensis A TaxID=2690445 RepID=A0A8J8CJC0_9CYAN|nr:AraC family transcriptional regulator [Myxacorys almedinensis]NDJ17451.1 helix-turn-helix domain-containing protein [Myxacorys almedinensis A]